MASASLSSLPPELLARICDFMVLKSETISFALCSRKFYGVAVPYLYRHIDLLSLPRYDHIHFNHGDWVCLGRHIETLARLFLRNPELGGQVRHLAIRMCNAPVFRQILQPLEPELEVALRQVLPSPPEYQVQEPSEVEPISSAQDVEAGIEGDEGSDWSTTDGSVFEDEPDSSFNSKMIDRWIYSAGRDLCARANLFLTILLTRLPRLERLDIEMGRAVWNPVLLDSVFDASRNGIPPFQSSPLLANLNSVCYGHTTPEERGATWTGACLLPGVKSIYLHRLQYFRDDSWNGVTPSSLDFTHLELRDCRLRPRSLTRVVASSKSLHTFIYVVGEVLSPRDRFTPISYKSLRDALVSQKDSLEQIWIDYPHDYAFDPMSSEHTGPMGSFSGFTKLKHLHIAGTYLFGYVWTDNLDVTRLVRSLPEQIETVHLSHADEDDETIEGILHVVAAKEQGRLRNFRELRLDAPRPWIALNRAEIKHLVDLARTVNLEIRLFDNHSDTRIEEMVDRVAAAKTGRLGYAHERFESPWGFNGEVTWPKRASGCMQKPIYEEIPISRLSELGGTPPQDL
ncbi:hypothetical protein BJ170DRAFT_637838 [Xylariales sp. AK1849]|nr:hypothetical protein BJ170DRAFT_637838 [Xylariales sp. AK1849]